MTTFSLHLSGCLTLANRVPRQDPGVLGRYMPFALAVLLCGACASMTPQENFKRNLQSAVGSRADRPNVFLSPDLLLSETVLANGNVEYVYRYSIGCNMKFVVDERTQIIVAASFDGDEKACVWVP